MSHAASLRVATLALATCACALAISPWSTQAAPAAATCAAAPKPTAPEGSHWRYHTDRATNRKCWYLTSEGGRKIRSAAMKAQTAPEPQVRVPAPPVNGDGIKHLTQPFADAPAQAPIAQAPAAAQVPAPAPPSNAPSVDAAPAQAMVQAPAPEAAAPANVSDQPQRVDSEAQVDAQSTVLAAPPAPVQAAVEPAVAPKRAAAGPDADNMKMLPFALGALAAALLAAGAILFASGARRRQERIVRIVDLNTKPRLPRAPNLADLSIFDEDRRGDNDDRDGQRRAPWRRQAA